MRVTKAVLAFAVLVSNVGFSGALIAAEGVLLPPGALAAKERGALQTDIAKSRASRPDLFQKVSALRAELAELDENKRGRYALLTRPLSSLGSDAVPVFIEEMVFEARPREGLADSAWEAWRIGLIEALGNQRDTRAEAVLKAIVELPTQEPQIVRAAAEALGKLGTDRVATKLVDWSRVPGPKRSAVLSAMGYCRRPVVARALESALREPADGLVRKGALKALGDVGSAWAWKASGDPRREEAIVRLTAAEALLRAYTELEGELRETAAKAFLVVDHPSALRLIEVARRGKNTAVVAALDALAARVKENPVH